RSRSCRPRFCKNTTQEKKAEGPGFYIVGRFLPFFLFASKLGITFHFVFLMRG
ncbi:hypothetical protein HMPREF0083_03758, partial [Aneurinibacillus aneurinilyticus ATCC 12856]